MAKSLDVTVKMSVDRDTGVSTKKNMVMWRARQDRQERGTCTLDHVVCDDHTLYCKLCYTIELGKHNIGA